MSSLMFRGPAEWQDATMSISRTATRIIAPIGGTIAAACYEIIYYNVQIRRGDFVVAGGFAGAPAKPGRLVVRSHHM